MKTMSKGFLALGLVLGVAFVASAVLAGHNGAVVNLETNTCEPTTFSATIADPGGTHKVGNMRLVVDDGETVQFTDPIPTDGSVESLSVGPFFMSEDTTVSWRVFGGAERDYDDPLWNGHGESDFTANINAYADSVGSFNWVVGGVDNPNPFTTWHEMEVPGCSPQIIQECMKGGWADFGFKNQGQCIRFVNTGKDSR